MIDIPDDRARSLDLDKAQGLAVLIEARGLYHPILVRAVEGRFQLVSGLHRLVAFRHLNRLDIPCQISQAQTYDEAKLDEVLENLGRNELNALDRCHHLFELKQVWERKYPQTAHGGDRGNQHTGGRRQSLPSANFPQEIFGFARANAEKLGLSQRSIRLAVAIWEGLSPASRDRLIGTPLACKQTELKALSQLSAKQQAQVLDLIIGEGDVKNVAGALQAIDGGVVPNAMEKRLTVLRQQVDELPDPVFDRLISDNIERVVSSLKRAGHI